MRPASVGAAGIVLLLLLILFALAPGDWFSCEFWLGTYCSVGP